MNICLLFFIGAIVQRYAWRSAEHFFNETNSKFLGTVGDESAFNQIGSKFPGTIGEEAAHGTRNQKSAMLMFILVFFVTMFMFFTLLIPTSALQVLLLRVLYIYVLPLILFSLIIVGFIMQIIGYFRLGIALRKLRMYQIEEKQAQTMRSTDQIPKKRGYTPEFQEMHESIIEQETSEQKGSPKICAKCGHRLTMGEKFCTRCGTRIDVAVS